MRLTLAILPFAGLALAQTTVSSAANATTTGVSSAQSQCITNRCARLEGQQALACAAECAGVPNPSIAQVNATQQCASACPQGNGTQAQNDIYSTCLSNCINNNFLASLSSTASSSATARPTSSGSASTGGSTGSNSSTGSSDGSSNSNSNSSNDAVRVLVSTTALLGLFAAFFTL